MKHITIDTKVACLILLTLLAVYQDLKSYKIKNHTILLGFVLGLLINLIEVGCTGILIYIPGIFIPILILFPLFLFKTLGAGDIKLFSVIGGFYGISYTLKIIIVSFIIAAIMSLIYMIRTKSFLKRFRYFLSYIQKKKQNKLLSENFTLETQDSKPQKIKITPYYQKEKAGREGVIHFSISILLAIIICHGFLV